MVDKIRRYNSEIAALSWSEQDLMDIWAYASKIAPIVERRMEDMTEIVLEQQLRLRTLH